LTPHMMPFVFSFLAGKTHNPLRDFMTRVTMPEKVNFQGTWNIDLGQVQLCMISSQREEARLSRFVPTTIFLGRELNENMDMLRTIDDQ
jgi:hypothetical protein